MGGCKDCGPPALTEITQGDEEGSLASAGHPLILVQHGPIVE